MSMPTAYDRMIRASTLCTWPSAFTSASPVSNVIVSTTSGAGETGSMTVSTGKPHTFHRGGRAARLVGLPSRSMSPHRPRAGQIVPLSVVRLGNKFVNVPAADISLNDSVSGVPTVSKIVNGSCVTVTRPVTPTGETAVNLRIPCGTLSALNAGAGKLPWKFPFTQKGAQGPGFAGGREVGRAHVWT